MTIFEQLIAFCSASTKTAFVANELRDGLSRRFGTNPSSVIPSDYCYNRWNRGLGERWKPVFVRSAAGEYAFVGADCAYTSLVYAKPREGGNERVVGEWTAGRFMRFADPSDDAASDPASPSLSTPDALAPSNVRSADRTLPLSAAQVDRLFAEYADVLKIEIAEFGCQPTEARHLIGRLGELHCARVTGGTLATRVNQAGFDVVGGDGRRISVKTTAQRAGFVTISAKTLDRVDDLMVLQYDVNEGLRVVYFGDVRVAVDGTRLSAKTQCFELDLARARRLAGRPLASGLGPSLA